MTLKVPLSIGTLQWGSTSLDEKFVNPNGCISDGRASEIVAECRSGQVTLFDTAEGYGGGTSEIRLGQAVAALAKSPDENIGSGEILLMTKFLPTPWRHSHACFERALRASLRNLGITCCHIYLLHTPVHWRPIEFWVESAAMCHRKGLLKAFGLSNCDAEQVRRAHEAGKRYGVPVVLNQVMYSLLDYGSPKLREMEKACNELGIKIVAYSPLGQGLLTDSLTPEKLARNRPAKMTGMTWERLLPLRQCIRSLAETHKKSMAQVVLNWCIQHETIPLVGCRCRGQAQDSLRALDFKLRPEEVEQLDTLALSRSTLDSPRWRRQVFVVLAGLVMHSCRILDWIEKAKARVFANFARARIGFSELVPWR